MSGRPQSNENTTSFAPSRADFERLLAEMARLKSLVESTPTLRQQVEELRERNEKLSTELTAVMRAAPDIVNENARLREENERLKHAVRALQRDLYGRGREKLTPLAPYPANGPRQLYLPGLLDEEFVLNLETEMEQRADARDQAIEREVADKKKMPGHGRRAEFPKNAPRLKTVIDLPEDEKTCACGTPLSPMKPESHTELERVEFTVVHTIERKKYCCRKCDGILEIAKAPPQVIERGILAPSFLSILATERFGNHMPYHRLEKKLRGEGLSIARSLMCASMARLSDLMDPIYQRQLKELLGEVVIHCDDTPVTILQSKSGTSATGYVWVYCDHQGRVIYTHTEKRTRDGPEEVLKRFRGYLQADAFSGFDGLFAPGDILEVACFAHARRKLFQAIPTNKLARESVELINDLYRIEREAKEAGIRGDALRAVRQQQSVPILKTLHDWLCLARTKVLDKSVLGKAIGYSLNQWEALCRYTESGELEIDNNRAERNLRPIAVGRNNWTFLGNEDFGRKAAVLFSLIATCREIKIEPRVYLWDVMQRISVETDVAKLTPHGWKEHFLAPATVAWEAHVAKLSTASIAQAS